MMTSNKEYAKNLIQTVKAKRKKKRIILSSVVLSICAFLCFAVGYSNIITIDMEAFQDSYVRYLVPYLSQEGEIGLRFVDAQNAVVNIESKTYPCALKATSETAFTLTVVKAETEETLEAETQMPMQEEPSIFHVEFWDTNAKISWNIFGKEIEKVLSVTEEWNVPTGLWSLFAKQHGDDGKLNTDISGAGWTLILENGDSYTGEGRDSAYRSKFISIGDTLLQCAFDPISGLIMDASVFFYDETSYDYPVIKERYLSDGGEPSYFYSQLLPEEQKIDFQGGTFTASAVMRETENHPVDKSELLDERMAKWQLLPESEREMSPLSLNATLDLSEDGLVKMKISGHNGYDGFFKGKWYPLKHSVLVVLDEKSALTGRLFTLYVDSVYEQPTGELITNYAQSRIESLDCYKIGYHTFQYYVVISETLLYWGNEWTSEKLSPQVQYETEYVLYGRYYYEYYDGQYDKYSSYEFTENLLIDMPVSGKISFVFHEDGTATITHASGKTETRNYELSAGGKRIEFERRVEIWQGANATMRPWEINSNFVISLCRLDVDFFAIYSEYGTSSSYVYWDENGNRVQLNSYVIYYEIQLQPKLD